MPFSIDVLTVTYGNRWPTLRDTLLALKTCPYIRRVTIMDNGSIYSIAEQLHYIETVPVQLILLPENLGSASAYGMGMQILSEQEDVQQVLLLDDDLLLHPDCTRALHDAYQTLLAQHAPDQLMLQCMRPDRAYLKYAAKGKEVSMFFPMPDHFLGFHLFRPDIRLRKRKLQRTLGQLPDQPYVSIPCAPYGGLLMHKSAILRFGIPNAVFHTYADDFDHTLRCTRQGAALYLIPNAIAEDRVPTLVNKRKGGFMSAKFFDMPDRHLFLLMRNTAAYTRQQLVRHLWMYQLNRYIYTGYLFCSALLHGKWRSFKIFTFAVRQGTRGILRTTDIPD